MNKIKNIDFFITFQKVSNLIKQADSKYFFVITGTAIFTSLIPAVSLKVMQKIINIIQTQIDDFNEILIFVGIYLILDLILIVTQFELGYYKEKFSKKFNLEIKKKVLEKASHLKLDDFENSETYDMLQRADNQVEGGLISFFDKVILAISTLITGISYFVIVFSFRGWIAPLIAIIPIIRFVINNRINNEEFKVIKERTDDERKAWYNGYLITSGISFKELKVYSLFSHFIERYEEMTKKFIYQDLKISKKRLIYMMTFSFVEQILIGVLFAYVIYCGVLGSILIGDVITYTKAIVSSKGQTQSVIQMISDLNKSRMYVDQLFDFLAIEESKSQGNIEVNEINNISINNLSYKYPGNDNYTLKNINLNIEKGDFVALVGRNGSGKSTLMKILIGLYDDYEGEIRVNGFDLKEINKATYSEHMGALFQDFIKYEGTIRENVSYGNIKARNKDENIYEACRNFNLSSLILSEEKGLDTQLGYWFESGKQISYGQWQKIALSRTFIRNADLYFLDEPNAALDVVAEYNTARLYERLFKGKIGVVIVHKFNHFISKANKIVVLKDGQIKGLGSHEHLFLKCEEYKKLFELQQENK